MGARGARWPTLGSACATGRSDGFSPEHAAFPVDAPCRLNWPFAHSGVAQLAARMILVHEVGGSSPPPRALTTLRHGRRSSIRKASPTCLARGGITRSHRLEA